MPDEDAPPEDAEIQVALAEMQHAIEALRRAQAVWVGAKPWSGGRTWDMTLARRAIEEAADRLHAARVRLDLALAMARRREIGSTTQGS